jgi:DNA-binding Lrp family transcriptional regulator
MNWRLFVRKICLCAKLILARAKMLLLGNHMTQAYILLNVEGGTEDTVLKQIRKIVGVEQAYVSYGVYDLIAKVKADTMQEIKDVVTHKIRQIKQVQSTLTLLMVEE